jgi:hypothetical protein
MRSRPVILYFDPTNLLGFLNYDRTFVVAEKLGG